MVVNATLNETLFTIAVERRGAFHRGFALVDRLVAELGEVALAHRLDSAISSDCPWEVVADLFGVLAWSTSDNGESIQRAAESWLRASDDLRRIRIALHLDTYPFRSRSEMEATLRDVANRFPEVAARCEELIEQRRPLLESGNPPAITQLHHPGA